MSGLRIEPATIEDLPRLADLLYDLFSGVSDFIPDREKHLRGLRLIIEEPGRGRIFVLRNDSIIIGMINLLITISTAEGGFVLVLEDLVIAAPHRGQGYGARLLEYAMDYAKRKNFLRVTLLTDRKNARLKDFYKKHGFVESTLTPLRRYFRHE